MPVQKYRKLPDQNVEGIQWNGSNQDEILAWCPIARYKDGKLTMYPSAIEIPVTSHIVKDQAGNYIHWPDDQLTRYYEPIGPPTEAEPK